MQFGGKNLPYTLMGVGLLMNAVDIATGSAGSGGKLYGPQGWLRQVNDMLPKVTVPGTKGVTSIYPEGIPVALGGWLFLAGLILLLWRKYA